MGQIFSKSCLPTFARPSTWILEPEASTFAENSSWSNKDMDPVPLRERTWTMLNYVTFWISCAVNVSVWQLASSMLAIGLSWRQALLAISLGHLVIAVVIVLIGTIGARLRVPISILARSSFGFWLSYFCVISLIILSMFWFGVQTFIGSECIYQMLKAIWPSIAHLPNHLPANASITTTELLCYFLYWSIQLPFMFVSPQKIRFLFLAKAIIVPPTWLALLIWAFVRVPPSRSLLTPTQTLSGKELLWAWLSAFNSAIGFFASLSVNMPNFTRYAKNERAQYIQLLVIPALITLASFVGITVTSAGISLYGQILWDPLKLIDHWDNRACAFFTSLVFALSTLASNISANSLDAGNEMAALYPRYINILRGQVICAFLGGWALCPWKILASAPGFLSFVNGYTVFIGPMTGIIITDYWLVHRTRVDVPSMYRPRGRYRYIYGINWRAAVAMAVSVPPSCPGLIASIKGSARMGAGTHLFDIAFMLGLSLASLVYFTLSKLFPSHETVFERAIIDLEKPLGDKTRGSVGGSDGQTEVLVQTVVE
ncbi:NCS1 nucleoside transporter family [Russula ochroleuca]|uniref:NCS1 nucleoside transporter family n=1 Tax=Russula ochroleuca TaxID=152965 RepID=A0A9P5TBV6_9AGAM|nr:NCS1 nucleoside transporter family [Russula ochroleuca]